MKSLFPITFLIAATIVSAKPIQQTVQPSEAKSVVQKLIVDLDSYVFPEKAAFLKAFLNEHMAAYESIKSPTALAEKLTSDMRAATGDKHLAGLLQQSTAEQ
jgi:hypothetical protein